MTSWNSDKPFGFLQTAGAKAIQVAKTFLESTKAQAKNGKQVDLPLSWSWEANETDIERTNFLLAAIEKPDLHNQLPVGDIQRLVFEETNQLLQGLVLIAASVAAKSKSVKDNTQKKFESVLANQYGLLDEEVVEKLTVHWLDEVISLSEAQQADSSRSKRTTSDSYKSIDCSNELQKLDSDDMAIVKTSFRRLVNADELPLGFVEKCKALLTRDLDSQLTMAVIRQLVLRARSVDKEEINAKLTHIVSNENCRLELRDVAYQALYELNELPVPSWPEVLRTVGKFRFPDDVDWGLVKKFSGG